MTQNAGLRNKVPDIAKYELEKENLTMSKKKFGKFVALATISGVIAAGISYFLKYKSFHDELDEDFHDFEGDDDEFDGNLPHASETPNRTYVTISEKTDEAADLVKDGVNHAADAVKNVAEHAADAVRDAADHASASAGDAAHFAPGTAPNAADHADDADSRDVDHYFAADPAVNMTRHTAYPSGNTADHSGAAEKSAYNPANAAAYGSEAAKRAVQTSDGFVNPLSDARKNWPQGERDSVKEHARTIRDTSGSATIIEDDLP